MARVRVADDIKAVRLRLEELRREPGQLHADGPVQRPPSPDPEAVALTGRGPERTRNRFRLHFGTDVRGPGITPQSAPNHQAPEATRSL